MKKITYFFIMIVSLGLSACDLQPKIVSIPESVGDFISSRYPAMLADPEKQPEIYNSAAADYGEYESTDLYGNGNIEDYILYADADDYSPEKQHAITTGKTEKSLPDQYLNIPKYKSDTKQLSSKNITVAKGDTLYSLSKKHNTSVKDLADNNKLSKPYALSIGQKLNLEKAVEQKNIYVESKPVIKPKIYELTNITVKKGDTLYSLSRNYELPVNDLAVLNKLSAPFSLSVGQKLKVPKLNKQVQAKAVTAVAKTTKSVVKKSSTKKTAKVNNTKTVKTAKISSKPLKALPKIANRSSSKFTWPVRGKILSGYGAKSNGLYNDGINISASAGKSVVAAENGVVAYAGNELKGMGNLVIVQHSSGWMTVYAHLGDMYVRRGVKVRVGHKIGTVGKSGKVDKPQLHFEIRKGTKSYNPTKRLK